MARKRSNKRPEIVGQWSPRTPLQTGTPDEPLPAAPDSPEYAQTFADQDMRLHEARERQLRDLEAAEPHGYRSVGEMLSTTPRSKRKKGAHPSPADVLRNELVAQESDDLDVGSLLDAVVTVMNLAFDATLGVGQGGLFNFEEAALSQLVQLARRLEEHRSDAAASVRRQQMLDELATIYQTTVDGAATKGRTAEDRRAAKAAGAKALSGQELALRSFLERNGLPASKLKHIVFGAPEIHIKLGAVKTAARVLHVLGYASESMLTKERARVSPFFEYRATRQEFAVPTYNTGEDGIRTEIAARFAKFAGALFTAASSNPPTYVTVRSWT